MLTKIIYLLQVCCLVGCSSSLFAPQISDGRLDGFDVVWNSPSKSSISSMPIGNGDISANVWAERGGEIFFFIGKNDSWDENGRLLKLGKIKVELEPALAFSKGFSQRLSLRESKIEIVAKDVNGDSVKLSFLVDANNPAIYLLLDSSVGHSVKVDSLSWRTEKLKLDSTEVSDLNIFCNQNQEHYVAFDLYSYPDYPLENSEKAFGWYHRNETSENLISAMKIQGLDDYPNWKDPILNRTFGVVAFSNDSNSTSSSNLTTTKQKSASISFFSKTLVCEELSEWISSMEESISVVESTPLDTRLDAHREWWCDFWERSWIYIDDGKQFGDAFIVSRAYALQRYITASASRGDFPVKFNGSIFNVDYEGKPASADYRRWGPGYWWQNSRLPYVALSTSGDYDLMKPFFRMYGEDLLNISKYRTKKLFSIDGAFFPECLYFWGGNFTESYGDVPASRREDKLQFSPWHKWEFVSGLELAWMMFDYYEHTEDDEFFYSHLLPTAEALLRFFDGYYQTNESGKLHMHPSQALETIWDTVNPMPEVAGLRAVTDKLLLNKSKLDSQFLSWLELFSSKIPDLPLVERGGEVFLSPAEKKLSGITNVETPELYAIFPFRQYGVGKDGLDIAVRSVSSRNFPGFHGWRQDDIFLTYAGMAEEAKKGVVKRAKKYLRPTRFPGFWGPNYDWTPDQCHGGVLMKSVQSMLLQTDGDKIYIKPALPKGWNADFKLMAPGNTSIVCKIQNGEVASLEITPKSREKDVVICK
ncbi:MAG: hypothetical protein JXR63_08970 [Spirochaetales bacterium]|nr:hypothetical protein [Spirochaetales bacterium]